MADKYNNKKKDGIFDDAESDMDTHSTGSNKHPNNNSNNDSDDDEDLFAPSSEPFSSSSKKKLATKTYTINATSLAVSLNHRKSFRSMMS